MPRSRAQRDESQESRKRTSGGRVEISLLKNDLEQLSRELECASARPSNKSWVAGSMAREPSPRKSPSAK